MSEKNLKNKKRIKNKTKRKNRGKDTLLNHKGTNNVYIGKNASLSHNATDNVYIGKKKGNNNTGIKRNSIDETIDKAYPEKAREEEYKLIDKLTKDENYTDKRDIGKLHIIGEKDEETTKFQKAVDDTNSYMNAVLDESQKIRESKQPLSLFDKIKNKVKEWFGA